MLSLFKKAHVALKKLLPSLSVVAFVLAVSSAWLFVPQTAHAITCGFGSDIGGGECRGFITTTGDSSWTVPDDWNDDDNTVEVIGGGGGGGTSDGAGRAGGGGGAYSATTSIDFTPGASVAV